MSLQRRIDYSIDGQVILGWFRDYFEERCEEAARFQEKEGIEFKDRDQRVYTPEIVSRMLGEHWSQKKTQRDLDDPGWNGPKLPPFDEKHEKFYLPEK